MTGRIVDLTMGFNRKQRLTLELDEDFREQYDSLKELPLDIKISRHRKKRSLDANAYLWVMLQKLAEKLDTTKEELYREKIKKYGIFREFVLTEGEAKSLRFLWERQGIGWVTELVDYDQDGERQLIHAYYGSSTYNTKQMSRIINAVVDDCKEQGIETLSERELSLIVDRWEGGLP